MKIKAYAKLNLCLDITGIREDGYHLLDMVMQEISIADDITVEKADFVKITGNVPENNTLEKAAKAFFAYTGIDGGADIYVEKNIPSDAGLGGGSSDAASVLTALNSLYGAGLEKEQLVSIASGIGSDVPFFITGGCARVAGVGESTASIKNSIDCVYVLAKPFTGVSTKECYEEYHRHARIHPDIMSVVDGLREGDRELFRDGTGNALYRAAVKINPDIDRVLALFTDAEFSMMTGSGSCVFGMYENRDHAAAAYERIKKEEFVSFCAVAEAVNREA